MQAHNRYRTFSTLSIFRKPLVSSVRMRSKISSPLFLFKPMTHSSVSQPYHLDTAPSKSALSTCAFPLPSEHQGYSQRRLTFQLPHLCLRTEATVRYAESQNPWPLPSPSFFLPLIESLLISAPFVPYSLPDL